MISKEESLSSESSSNLQPERKRARFSSFSRDSPDHLPSRTRIESDNETGDDENISNRNFVEDRNDNNEWSRPQGNQPHISFTGLANVTNTELQVCAKIEDFYSLLVTDEIFEMIADETNIYATQRSRDCHRLKEWIPTNKNEIKQLFGLIIWMGLVKLPNIQLYWSKDVAYTQSIPRRVMSRNRFEILLRMLHFSNDEEADENDRLSKIRTLIDMLNENFKKYYDPDEIVCVDESLVPFHGRIFKQHLKLKEHKNGVKIVKLCCGPGYTYNFCVYGGKSVDAKSTPTNIIMSLCKDILGKGHTVYINNWYTSIYLAEKLLEAKTHLVGMLRKNEPELPEEVKLKRLNQGELIAREKTNGLTVFKWKDKRDVLLLSTKHSTEMVYIHKKSNSRYKPAVIVDYKAGKASADLSDKMVAYCNPLRRAIKWYRKVALTLLLNMSIVNALILFQKVHNRIKIAEFRKNLAMYLMQCQEEVVWPIAKVTRPRHEIKIREGTARKVRRCCKNCYKKNVEKYGRQAGKNRTKRVLTFCEDCDGSPHLCLPCFNELHRHMST